jgi:hypothetical protein
MRKKLKLWLPIIAVAALGIAVGSCPADKPAPEKKMKEAQQNPKQLVQYVIYNKPKDHPHHYVVREWLIGPGTATPGKLVGLADNLKNARQLVPPGMDLLPRFANDDPVIEEVWM